MSSHVDDGLSREKQRGRSSTAALHGPPRSKVSRGQPPIDDFIRPQVRTIPSIELASRTSQFASVALAIQRRSLSFALFLPSPLARPSITMPPRSSAPAKAGRSAPPTKSKQLPPLVNYYLIAYNLVAFFGWFLIFTTLLKHLGMGPQTPSYPISFAGKVLARFRPLRILFSSTYSRWPEPLATLLVRASSMFASIGGLVALVQSIAILEVVHAAIGWVRSPVPTTAIQVASRLFMVWAVTEKFSEACTNPLYTTMVLAWSITESIRYPFYATGLMSGEGGGDTLLWARYTLFYILYPLGAGSEAMLIFSTLPNYFPWQSAWTLRELVYGGLFVIWWPGLYVMYSHMMKQRRRAIGKGFWGDKITQARVEKRKQAIQEAARKLR